MLHVKDSNSMTELVPQMPLVPLPPRPIEKDSDSSDDYVDYLPPSPRSQSPPIDAEPFKDRADATTNLQGKQRRKSRVSFSDTIQIISSDDEREDQIESCFKDLKENCELKEGSVGGLKFQEKYSNPSKMSHELISEVPLDYKCINDNTISATSIPPKYLKPKPGMGFPTLLRKELQNVLIKDQIKSSPLDLEANGGPLTDFPGNNFGVGNHSPPLNHSSDIPPEADSVVPPDYKYIEGSTVSKTSIPPKSPVPKLAKSEMGSPKLIGKELQNVLDQIESSFSDWAENYASKKGFAGNHFKMENNSFAMPEEADSEAPPVYKHISDNTTAAPPLLPGYSRSPKSKLAKSGMGFPTMLRSEFQNTLAEKCEVQSKTPHNKKRTNLVRVVKKPSEPPPLPPKGITNAEIISRAQQIEITDSVAETEETCSPIHLPAETPIASLTKELLFNNMPQCRTEESRLQRHPNEEPEFEEDQSSALNRASDIPPKVDYMVLPDYKYIEDSTISRTSISPKSPIPKLPKSEMGSSTLFGKELQNVLVEDQIESDFSDLAENCESKKGFSGNHFKMENQPPQPHFKPKHKLSNAFNMPQEADSEAPPVNKHISDDTTSAPPLPPRPPKSKVPKSGMGFPTMLRNEFQNALAEIGKVYTQTPPNKKRTNVVHVFKKPSELPHLPLKGIRNAEIISGAEQIEVPDSFAETEETCSPIHLPAETPIASLRQELVCNNMPQCSPDESRLQRYSNEEPEFEEGAHPSYHMTDTEKKLNIAMNDLYNNERNYINRLQAGLQIRDELRAVRISEKTLDKFFGFLEDVHIFHEKLFLPDLCNKSQTTKNILLSFLKHFMSIDIYMKRQWMIPYESDLDQFERSLVDKKNLKPYLNITKDRVKEYIKILQSLKANYMEQENENNEIVKRALRVMENLLYQLEMVDQFKKIEDKKGKLKVCGRVHLNCLFKASYNRNKNYIYLVYLCENSVILTSVQDRTYLYVDDLPISNMYCITRKNKPKRFEIGIKHEKNYILKASTKAVRDQWCDKLRTMLRFDQFCEQ